MRNISPTPRMVVRQLPARAVAHQVGARESPTCAMCASRPASASAVSVVPIPRLPGSRAVSMISSFAARTAERRPPGGVNGSPFVHFPRIVSTASRLATSPAA